MSRRRVELLVLAFGVLFAGAVVYSLRARLRPAGSSSNRATSGLAANSTDGQATTVLSGFDYTETVRGKPVFRIRSERTVGFGPAAGLAPDRYALEKVALTLFTEGGAPVEVHADAADYDMRTKAAVLKGNVRWSDEKGALGETDTVTFQPEKRMLEAPKKIHLAHGSFDAQALSGRYDVLVRPSAVEDRPGRQAPRVGAGVGQRSGSDQGLRLRRG